MVRYQYTGEGVSRFDRLAGSHSPAFLIALYRSMLRIRRIEEEIERRYDQNQMKTPIHLVIGQEATAVGCCAVLADSDLVYSSHRTHGAYLAKGGDLKAMLCEMHCKLAKNRPLPRAKRPDYRMVSVERQPACASSAATGVSSAEAGRSNRFCASAPLRDCLRRVRW